MSEIAQAVGRGEGSLIDLLSKNAEIVKAIDRPKLEQLLDPDKYLGLSAAMTDRVLAQLHS